MMASKPPTTMNPPAKRTSTIWNKFDSSAVTRSGRLLFAWFRFTLILV